MKPAALLVLLVLAAPAPAQWCGHRQTQPQWIILTSAQIRQLELARSWQFKYEMMGYAQRAPTENLLREKDNPNLVIREAARAELTRREVAEKKTKMQLQSQKTRRLDRAIPGGQP